MKEHEIDNLFRNGLEKVSFGEPSKGVWDNIASELEKDVQSQKSAILPIRPRKTALWPKLSVAAAILVLLGIGTFYLRPEKESSDNTKLAVTETRVASPTISDEVENSALVNHESNDNAVGEREQILVSGESEKAHPVRPAPIQAKTQVEVHRTEDVNKVFAISEEGANLPKGERADVHEIQLASIEVDTEALSAHIPKQVGYRSVTTMEPVQPLITSKYEEEDSMIASATRKSSSFILNSIVNTVSNKVSEIIGKEEVLSSDEEGTISVDLPALFAKTRFKKH